MEVLLNSCRFVKSLNILVKPKKYLGQHFLNDHNIARKIANSLDIDGDEFVFEVGPGTGILTQFLLERFEGRLKLFEIDSESIPVLYSRFPQLSDSIIHSDFLNIDMKAYAPARIAIIGNFPYNISSQILFKVLENRNQVMQVVCMLQKEVAQRIASPPGSKDYGILSVLLQAYYTAEYLFSVGEQVFYPPPKVKSGVIRLKRNQRIAEDYDPDFFTAIVKTAFNQRRKTLNNSLKSILDGKKLEENIGMKRAENLSVEDYLSLARKYKPL
jgi:16S rRNA (adenine1518-N6/adenine1519-N6)-dimethyltransferase